MTNQPTFTPTAEQQEALRLFATRARRELDITAVASLADQEPLSGLADAEEAPSAVPGIAGPEKAADAPAALLVAPAALVNEALGFLTGHRPGSDGLIPVNLHAAIGALYEAIEMLEPLAPQHERSA